MKKRITAVGALALIAAGLGAVGSSGESNHAASPTSSSAGSVSLAAKLTTTQQSPRPKSVAGDATGTFTATLKGSTLTWALSFAHLTGTPLSASVNEAAPGASGPLVIALCSRCKSPASGSTLLGKTLVSSLEHGDTYVDIVTKKNPRGEIRGQLKRHG